MKGYRLALYSYLGLLRGIMAARYGLGVGRGVFPERARYRRYRSSVGRRPTYVVVISRQCWLVSGAVGNPKKKPRKAAGFISHIGPKC